MGSSARRLSAVPDDQVPDALQPYTIRVRPNWVARLSGAAVLLLLLFFAVTQYNETRSLNDRLDRAEQSRASADADRRIATEALDQARKAQSQAAKDRAVALDQNGQLIEVALALEDQIARLGVTPEVPRNSVLRLRARTAIAATPGNAPGLFVGPPSGAGGGSAARPSPAAANPRQPGGTPAPGAKPTASPTVLPPVGSSPIPTGTSSSPSPVLSASLLPSVPFISITACVQPLLCLR